MASNIQTSLDELKLVIRTCPIIDNHAHNILRPQQLKSGNLLTITTEASGDALLDTPKSLAHLRAVRQLKKLYGLPSDADWAAVVGKRVELLERDADGLMKKCFEGTHTILLDDLLDDGSNIEAYGWHNRYTASPCKRIARIEAVAASLLSTMHQQGNLPVGVAIADEDACNIAWASFVAAFESAIVAALQDDEVVGFKSVICYRTGLDVRVGRDTDVSDDGLRAFTRHYLPDCLPRDFRVEAKGMNDALVISACKLIAADFEQRGAAKPLQFHTGLGDDDINLLDSNPACLQELVKYFPTVPVVLLHSSYPYTREAGYLATVYKNVYLDIGEVFPMVSREGQEKIVRQALELTPTSKILWSTDGHNFPETYWLANVQGREAIEKVLLDYVDHEDLTVTQAIEAAKDVFFRNSNTLYSLGLDFPDTLNATLATATLESSSNPGLVATQTVPPATELTTRHTESLLATPPDTYAYDLNAHTQFTSLHTDLQFVVVQWLDYLGTLRSRWLPSKSFTSLIDAGGRIGISTGNLGTLQNDHTTPAVNPVGQILVEPDLGSLRMMAIGTAPTATVMARFVDEDKEPLGLCPRSQLQAFADQLSQEYQIGLLIGFEIEVTFCERNETGDFEPMDTNHAWGTLTDEQVTKAFPIMKAIATALQDMGIEILQLHSEAGAGQYEFVLAPLPPVEAVDTLIQARQCIQQIAATYDLRATCHPQPFPGIGTAAHAHVSLNSGAKTAIDLEKLGMSFMASVLTHLPALCALTMPQAVSYGRVVDDSWTGGTWVAWGTQNREVPLRRVKASGGGTGSRWEVRCLDGMANMYLALGSIIGAGLDGIRRDSEMIWKDCTSNPTLLSGEQKREHGITAQLPTSFKQALEALENDLSLADALAPGVVAHYVAMKKAEQEMLDKMPEQERRIWLMERY